MPLLAGLMAVGRDDRREGEVERWYIRALPVALGFGVLGLCLGLVIHLILGLAGHGRLSLAPLIGAASFIGAYLVIAFSEAGGAAFGAILGGSSRGVSAHGWSYADSLAARGEYDAAVAAYRDAFRKDPRVPTPLVRAARVLRDRPGRDADALALFREARSSPGVDAALDSVLTREIVEIHAARPHERGRALAELGRFLERQSDSRSVEWARRRLDELRQATPQDTDD